MNYREILTICLTALLMYNIASIDVDFKVPTIDYGETTVSISKLESPRTASPQPAFFANASMKTNSILFVGDVLLARNVEYLMQKSGSDYPFSGVNFNDIAVHPYVVGNFEASVPKDHVMTEALKLNFSVNSIYLLAAKTAGFTHFSLANNHAYDFGKADYLNTKSEMDLADLQSFGHPKQVSKESISFLDLQDTRVAMIGIHTLERQPSELELKAIFQYAASQSDIQIAYVHWGIEYDNTSHKSQKLLAKSLIDAGADLIVGHHPHVVQEIAILDGVPVFYSLGNYIFDQYDSADTQDGLMLNLDFSDDPSIYLIPVTSQNSLSQPNYMKSEEVKKFITDLAKRSDPKLKDHIMSGVIPLDMLVATSSKMAMINW